MIPVADELVFGPTYGTLLAVRVMVLGSSVLALVWVTGQRLGYDDEQSIVEEPG